MSPLQPDTQTTAGTAFRQAGAQTQSNSSGASPAASAPAYHGFTVPVVPGLALRPQAASNVQRRAPPPPHLSTLQEVAAKLAEQSEQQRQGLGVVTSADAAGPTAAANAPGTPPPASRSATCVGSTSVVRNNGHHTAVHIHHKHARSNSGMGGGPGDGFGAGESGAGNGNSGNGTNIVSPGRNARPRHLQALALQLEHRSSRKRARSDPQALAPAGAPPAGGASVSVARAGEAPPGAAAAGTEAAARPDVPAASDTPGNTSSRGNDVAAVTHVSARDTP